MRVMRKLGKFMVTQTSTNLYQLFLSTFNKLMDEFPKPVLQYLQAEETTWPFSYEVIFKNESYMTVTLLTNKETRISA